MRFGIPLQARFSLYFCCKALQGNAKAELGFTKATFTGRSKDLYKA
jgi:hypothetical protein